MKESRTTNIKVLTKQCKCILTAILLLAVTFGFMPPQKAVAAEEYPLYLCGTKVTSENAADIMGDGNFSYDNEKRHWLSGETLNVRPRCPLFSFQMTVSRT